MQSLGNSMVAYFLRRRGGMYMCACKSSQPRLHAAALHMRCCGRMRAHAASWAISSCSWRSFSRMLPTLRGRATFVPLFHWHTRTAAS